MSPIRKYNNQNWLPSIFNDFFDNDWMVRANATAPAINVIERKRNTCVASFLTLNSSKLLFYLMMWMSARSVPTFKTVY